jgi:toxin HigB-1
MTGPQKKGETRAIMLLDIFVVLHLTCLMMSSITRRMEIESISHKALKRFFLTGHSKGLVGDVERLRAMLAFIAATTSLDELAKPPNYGLHRLTGNRSGMWSMAVTRNWRLTFTVTQTGTVTNMNLKDYHGS